MTIVYTLKASRFMAESVAAVSRSSYAKTCPKTSSNAIPTSSPTESTL